MGYTKPPANEVDDLERLGNPGWNWKCFEEMYRKLEGFIPPSEEIQKENDLNLDIWGIGKNGPLTIAYPTLSQFERDTRQTMINAGLSVAKKPMDGDPLGVFWMPNTYNPRSHTRSYAVPAYLLPSKDRPNLTVLVSAHVCNIISHHDKDGKLTATGVRFIHGGQGYVVHASKEVIISAGTLKTPQVLGLSGIGQKEVLDRINVPVGVNLWGVGENLQVHLSYGVSLELKDDVDFMTFTDLLDPATYAKHLELRKIGQGKFTSGVVVLAFVSLHQMSPQSPHLIAIAKGNLRKKWDTLPAGRHEQYQIQIERLEKGGADTEYILFPGTQMQYKRPVPGKRYVTMTINPHHAFSRGSAHSTFNDPLQEPEFDPHYFEEEFDLLNAVESVKFMRKIEQTSPLKDLIVGEHNPGPDVQTDEIKEFLKGEMATEWHTTGTCSMLSREKGGVVDPYLKVHGTNNIRVVDFSIIPLHMATHTSSVVYAIAELAAEFIKQDIKMLSYGHLRFRAIEYGLEHRASASV